MKIQTIDFLLKILGKSLAIISRFDNNIKDELNEFSENFIVGIKGPRNSLNIKINNNKIIVINASDIPNLIIGVKNTETLFNILIGKLSIHKAHSENRLIVKGDIHQSVRFVRILYICQEYIFPDFLIKRNLKTENDNKKMKFIKQLLIGE